jgi:hypothetical protein
MDLLAKAVTLKSIRLFDKEAKELLFSAKHAVLYKFTKETGWVNWEGGASEEDPLPFLT